MPMHVFHITHQRAVDAACQSGIFIPENYETEGFIHCSYLHQVVQVANLYYGDAPDLVLLEIDSTELPCEVKDENQGGGGELYPHIYCELPLQSIVKVHSLHRNSLHQWELPAKFSGVK